MKTYWPKFIGLGALLFGVVACQTENSTTMKEPICAKKPQTFVNHGIERSDPYFWLRERDTPEVLAYLESENAFLEAGLNHTKTFQDSLFEEMKGRIKEEDESVPYLKNGYLYYSRFETGKDYPIYCRKLGDETGAEEIILDENLLAEGKEYCQVGGLSVSPDNKWLAFAADYVSRRQYQIHVKNLETGEILDWKVENTTGGAAWANDNQTLFYTEKNPETLRSEKIWAAKPFQNTKKLVFEEKDDTYYTYCYKSKSGKYIIIGSGSTMTSEYLTIPADKPDEDPTLFAQRERGVEYDITHDGDRFIVRSNVNKNTNFALYTCSEDKTEKSHWKTLVEHNTNSLIEGVEAFQKRLIVLERKDGIQQFYTLDKKTGKKELMESLEAAANIGFGNNPEFKSDLFRFQFTSLTTPISTMEYSFVTGEHTTLKQQEVLGGFDASLYASERIIAIARDGAEVPISLVYNKSLGDPKNRPLLLYGYGSYGYSMDPYFSTSRLSLLDRGFIYAIAHIRGGEDKGRAWYEDGKLLKKKNTFTDFIDCGKTLVKNGYTTSEHLYAMGGSAGGLLMGAVMNMEPTLFNGIVASVPFVDVINTMLDETIPLTTGEYDEWGNPNDPEYFKYILSYSPYDNIAETAYPNLLITTGYHDSQVQYWEPAKWIARLREKRTNDNQLYLYTNMDAGHGGASGRFNALKEVALEYAFLLNLEGTLE